MNTATPAYALSVNDTSITSTLNQRLISLTLTDKSGLEADQLEITLSDHDSAIAIPDRGVTLSIAIGWQSSATGLQLTDKGTFIVDEVEHSGAPDKLIIRARSANFRAGFKKQKERSWHGRSLGDIAQTVAGENQLQLSIDSRMAQQHITHIDQTNR